MGTIYDILGAIIGYAIFGGLMLLFIGAFLILLCGMSSSHHKEEEEPFAGISKIIINIKYENDDDVSDAAQQPSSQTASGAPQGSDSRRIKKP